MNKVVRDTDSNLRIDEDASIAALTGGGFVIAWTTSGRLSTDVVYRVYDNSGVEINDGIVGNIGAARNNNEPVVRGLTDGSFIIAYTNDLLGRQEVAHRSASGGALGDFNYAGAGSAISAISLADGRFATVWNDNLITSGIFMEILDTSDHPNAQRVYTSEPWGVGTAIDATSTLDGSKNAIVHDLSSNELLNFASGALAGISQASVTTAGFIF